MTRYLLILIISILASVQVLLAQCPNGITLRSQAEVDDFAASYPNCTEISSLSIENAPTIVDLSPLSGLTRISWTLEIRNNFNLKSLRGLENITYIGGELIIRNNSSLEDLMGLQGLTELKGDITLSSNRSLKDLMGLENLNEFNSDLSIEQNDSLLSLQGIQNINSVQQVFIEYNPLLQQLTTFDKLEQINRLEIGYCPELLSLTGLDSLSTLGAFELTTCHGITSLAPLSRVSLLNNLRIYDCDGLITLEGLENIGNVRNFEVLNSDSLQYLADFKNLREVQNDLVLWSLPELKSVIGLDSLRYIHNKFSLLNLDSLSNLEGFQHLEKAGRLYFSNLSDLKNLSGLNNLTELTGSFILYSSRKITDLSGLENLKTIGNDFYVGFNHSLESLQALEQLISIEDQIEIKLNSQLNECAIKVICDLVDASGPLFIYDNGPLCSSPEDIKFFCGEYAQINIPVFIDWNQDGIQDATEPLYPSARVSISPSENIYYTHGEEGITAYLDFGTYQVNLDIDQLPDWQLTTGAVSQAFTLDFDNLVDTATFGIIPINDISSVYPTVISYGIRCNEAVSFKAFANNFGTTLTSGTVWFKSDSSTMNLSSYPLPDTIVDDHLIGWHFNNLPPGHRLMYSLNSLIPGPPDVMIGTPLHYQSWVNYTDVNGMHQSDTSNYQPALQCSYDPNDKLVSPLRENAYTLMGEWLVYTIRFQNTGNAEAYNIQITDSLDEKLDPNTFSLLGSSHSEVLTVILEKENQLLFDFKDIFLPDSTTNLQASQGFVTYRIKSKEDLPEMSIVQNTASIYFDLNPPIITNTTENVMLSTFDFDEDGYSIFIDCDDTNASVHPDAQEISNNGIDEDCDGLDYIVSTTSPGGFEPKLFPNPTGDYLYLDLGEGNAASFSIFNTKMEQLLEGKIGQKDRLDLGELAPGMYFLMIATESQKAFKRVVKF